jgi:hypothetical protein
LLWRAGLPWSCALAAAAGAPLALWQLRALGRGGHRDPARWEGLAFRAVAMLVVTAAALLLAFVRLSAVGRS